MLTELALDPGLPIVVVRTPPEVSLYHRFHSDLFGAVLERLSQAALADGVQPVVLPRVASQRTQLASVPGLLVPEHAIDAQSLISYAALTISRRRDDEPRGRGAGDAGAHDLPGPARSSGRTADRGRADARAGGSADGSSCPPARRARSPAGCGATPARWSSCSSPRWDEPCAASSPGGPRPGQNALGRLQLPAMRRRLRSAALPLHRHSLPQLLVDGALVALAYYLAFQLRFNDGPPRHYAELRSATIWWVLAGSLPILILAGVYQRRWRYAGQRDYEAVVRAVVADRAADGRGDRDLPPDARLPGARGLRPQRDRRGGAAERRDLPVRAAGPRVPGRDPRAAPGRSTSAGRWPRSAPRARASAPS